MLNKDVKYCYGDIAIVPAMVSNIEHRHECFPFKNAEGIEVARLPIFTAPMSSVVNERNFKLFEYNRITPILPRNIDINVRKQYLSEGKWVALSLSEFNELFIDHIWHGESDATVLIDIANGHINTLHKMVKKAKSMYKSSLIIMVGNIANPSTIGVLADCGADYVRMSVGSGCGCISTTQTGIHYPIASLISETYEYKKKLNKSGIRTPYIIADGGIRNYDDVIKALALGADFVMIGSVFSKLLESAADTYYYKRDILGSYVRNDIDPVNDTVSLADDGKFIINGDDSVVIDKLYKVFYGMASKRGQEDLNGKKCKTSEGVEKTFEVTTTISKWSDNMADYIRSAMSYTGTVFLSNFNPESVDTIVISPLTRESINK